MIQRVIALSFLFCAVSLGCSDDPVEQITNKITCRDVCGRYKDCIDSNYNVDMCVSKCEADASAEEAKEQKLNTCETCLDDKSCTDSVFKCGVECTGVVP
ncbi:MAG: hypothetical protein SFV15_10735 [Polyangiaceae bacterium]|nr:hypothetical protein [Polyangiaceae bacterium]